MTIVDAFYSIGVVRGPLSWLLARYIGFLSKSSVYEARGQENYDQAIASGDPIILALWHQQLMPIAGYVSRELNLQEYVIPVEGRYRGDILARASQIMGAYKTLSLDSDEGSIATGKRIVELIKLLRLGKRALIAPDGPYGPAFQLKPGLSTIATKSRAVVVPCGGWAQFGFRLRRWDRFLTVLPFGRISIVFGPPIRSEHETTDAFEARLVAGLHLARTLAISSAVSGIRGLGGGHPQVSDF